MAANSSCLAINWLIAEVLWASVRFSFFLTFSIAFWYDCTPIAAELKLSTAVCAASSE